MKNFKHWLLASIALIGLVVTSSLYTQAQQTATGKLQLEILEGQSCCVYGTAVTFGNKYVSFGITEFTGNFLSYHGTATWGCRDMKGTQTGWAVYISMSGNMKNEKGNTIPAQNVKISFGATNLVGGECTYTSYSGTDISLSGAVPMLEKTNIAGNYGKICELTTQNVQLKVVTNLGQAPGNYSGTLVIDLPSFFNRTCDGILEGTFYDAETQGLTYIGSMGSSGTTASGGTFEYKPGEKITFKLGSVTLGNAVEPAGNGSVFVTDLFGLERTEITDPNVIKVGKLLQGVDNDNNPDNGITIESSLSSQFTENNNVTALNVSTKLTALGKTVKKDRDVVMHLEKTAEEKLSENINVGYSLANTIPGNSNYPSVLAVDSGSNMYVAGVFQNGQGSGMVYFGSTGLYNNGSSSDIYVGKKNANGDRLWTIKGGSEEYNDIIKTILVDDAGNSYVMGNFAGTGIFGSITLNNQNDSWFVGKINQNGVWSWIATGYTISSIDLDNSGNIYIAGSYVGTGVFGSIVMPGEGEYVSNFFVGKMDNNGNWIRVTKSGGSDISALKIDNSGNSYMVGSFAGTKMFGSTTLTSTGSTVFIGKINNNGNWLWANQILLTESDGWAYANSFALDAQGNGYIDGSFFSGHATFGSVTLVSTGGNYNAFIAKIDSNGNRLNANDQLNGKIALDNEGNLFLVGPFVGTITLGSSQITNKWSDVPEYDEIVNYLAKLDSNLNPISAEMFEGLNISSIVTDRINNIYMVGAFEGTSISWGGNVFSGGDYSSMWANMIYKTSVWNKEDTLLYQTTPPEYMH